MTAEVVLEGIDFGEGPRWHEGRLWFSDFYQHKGVALSPDGTTEDIVTVENQPSGLGWLPDGHLLVVSMLDRRVLRLEPDGSLFEHADLSGIAEHICNDMVVSGDGRAYVGNFGYDIFAADPFRPATMALVHPDGAVEVAARDLHFPNGTMISSDGRTLIVAETMASRFTAFDIDPRGHLLNRRVWADVAGTFPDGACMDARGGVWFADAASPFARRVIEGGEITNEVETSRNCYACMLGGDDGKTLFLVTSEVMTRQVQGAGRGRIESVRVDIPHAGLP